HGGGTGRLRVWREPDAVVCEVRDAGRIDAPLVGRVVPSPRPDGGPGLWLANQPCDLVQLRAFDAGATVRVIIRGWTLEPADRATRAPATTSAAGAARTGATRSVPSGCSSAFPRRPGECRAGDPPRGRRGARADRAAAVLRGRAARGRVAGRAAARGRRRR